MAPKKKVARNSFSPETKAEALRLIFEDGYTAKQAAEYPGCSTFAIQQWKVAAKKNGKAKAITKVVKDAETAEPTVKKVKKKGKKTKKASKKSKTTAKKTVAVPSVDVAHLSPISFDEFVHGYWNECADAMDVMLLPPDLMPKAIQYVNNVLRYAYDQCYGQ